MFTAQRSLTESSHGSSRSSRRRSSRFLKFRIPQCVLLSLRSRSDFQSRCYSPGFTNLPPKELCGRKISIRHRRDRFSAPPDGSSTSSLSGLLLLVIAMLIVGRLPFYRQTGESISQKSIAVLPFENLSEDKDNAYFADGIQDEILTRLSKIADLKVISRTSTQQYQSKPGNLRRDREAAWRSEHS